MLAAGPLLAACGGGSSESSTAPTAQTGGQPTRGGHLRVAMLGGTPDDSLDADAAYNFPQVMRNFALYNGLTALDASGEKVNMDLAEEISSDDKALEWTIRLNPDITFHDGKPLDAKAVIFTLRRIADPKNLLSGGSVLTPIDLDNIQTLDPLTIRLRMKTPYSTFVEQISNNYYFGIVPEGYDPAKPIGTGPFKFDSFTPGEESVFVRNPDYHKEGLPYLDQLTIIDSFAEPTAALNALRSDAVDIFENAPPELAAQVEGDDSVHSLVSGPGLMVPFTMRTDTAPFDDVRVRQAMRLVIDRTQMLSSAVGGLGVVANDVYGLHDPCYDASLERTQDIEQAQALLKEAGQEGLEVELVTAPIAAGAVESAQILAQQAKEAGITVNVRNTSPTAFFANYLKWPFAQDFYSYSPFMSLAAQTSVPGAPFNPTHYDDPEFTDLYNQVNETADEAGRCEIMVQMQQKLFDEGGYIIPTFNRTLDIMSSKVNGFAEEAGTGIPLGNGDWENAWIA